RKGGAGHPKEAPVHSDGQKISEEGKYVDDRVKVQELAQEMMLAAELRCHCIQTVTGLMLPKYLANIEIIPKGPHCNTVEIIATLKNSQQTCLDPQAKWVKMIINKILYR
ncbi:PREDICTED: growth-regulated alpha protein-like, partial [Pterocles gutturalis]|uniref:growth-regulated alpha protein-like n=1 Tax=Pterocles gutturalis TaxID=240206 RepID=UPI000528F051